MVPGDPSLRWYCPGHPCGAYVGGYVLAELSKNLKGVVKLCLKEYKEVSNVQEVHGGNH